MPQVPSIKLMLQFGITVIASLSLLLPAAAAQVEAQRLTAENAQGVLWIYEPEISVSEVVVVMPGAHITADRYMWLQAGLSQPGRAIILVEADRTWRSVPGQDVPQPARLATIHHLIAAYGLIERRWPHVPAADISLIGHSLGGSVILEALDGETAFRNPWAPPPEDFRPITKVGRVIVLGASLQSTIGDIRIPYRRDHGPLRAPSNTRLLFIAAEHDLIGTPRAMQNTAARYQRSVRYELIKGGNHLAWGAGTGVLDRPGLDGTATIGERQQLDETLQLISEFLTAP